MDLGFFKKSIPTLLFLVLFSVVGITVFYQLMAKEERLKIYNPIDINPRLVDISKKNLKKNHKISDFELINQNGEIITNKTYENKIYIADFFFTRCQTICIAMAYNMSELQEYFKNDDDIMFLSHSVTPIIDSISVLKEYAIKKGVIDGKWNITTGSKKQIYDLARKNYFAVLDEGNGDDHDFIHTEQFVLIDKERRIRGFYDGTEKEDMKKIKKDISILKKEYN
ncbi:MAG: SCO family protein [Flavobacteriaceae bacterium]